MAVRPDLLCGSVFKGSECRYDGPETCCDGTYQQCCNPQNYRGFRSFEKALPPALPNRGYVRATVEPGKVFASDPEEAQSRSIVRIDFHADCIGEFGIYQLEELIDVATWRMTHFYPSPSSVGARFEAAQGSSYRIKFKNRSENSGQITCSFMTIPIPEEDEDPWEDDPADLPEPNFCIYCRSAFEGLKCDACGAKLTKEGAG